MQTSIAALLDARAIRPFQLLIVALVMLALVIDGLDIQLLSLVTPVILKEWAVSRAAFGPAMAAALIGMAAGASCGGWLGDRHGRKAILVAATFLFGIGTMAASMTHDVATLGMLRFVSGLGFGAAAPNGVALASEWLPRRAQSAVVGLLAVATPFGGLVGAGAVLWLLPLGGWRGCFLACGALALLLGAAMILALPESPAYLLVKGRAAKAQRLVRRAISGEITLAVGPSDADDRIPHQDGAPIALRDLIFAREFRRLNIGLWTGYFCVLFLAYAFSAWTPVFLTMSGFLLPQAITVSFAINLAAVTAGTGISFFIGRIGSRRPLVICCIGIVVCICAMAAALVMADRRPAASTLRILMIAGAGEGGFNGAAISIIYAMLAYAYPAAGRASGVGFGIMVGRLGGVLGALTGGALLALHGVSTLPFFMVLGSLALIALLGFLIVDRHMPARAAGAAG